MATPTAAWAAWVEWAAWICDPSPCALKYGRAARESRPFCSDHPPAKWKTSAGLHLRRNSGPTDGRETSLPPITSLPSAAHTPYWSQAENRGEALQSSSITVEGEKSDRDALSRPSSGTADAGQMQHREIGMALHAARRAARRRYELVALALKLEAGVKRHYTHRNISGIAWTAKGRILAPKGITRRQLYVLAHECGHLVLHRRPETSGTSRDTSKNMKLKPTRTGRSSATKSRFPPSHPYGPETT